MANQGHPRPLGPNGELLGGGGPEGVPGGEHDPMAVFLEPSGHLADGGGFTHAVHAHHQHHQGMGKGLGGVLPEHAGENFPESLAHGFGVFELIRLGLGPKLLDHVLGGMHAQIRGDEGRLQVIVKIVVDLPALEELVDLAHEAIPGTGKALL